MNQQAKNRTLGQRLVDWQWGKYTKLPAPRTDYTTTYDVRIPMRDGVELLANLLEPKGKASGTVLVTSPYGINMVGQAMTGGFMARRGYRVLLVKCRGTFGSGGTFEPFAQEADDAADIVAWMRERPWFDGRFATQGYSYLGFVQWALLMDPPPEMKAAVIACGPYDFSAFALGTGAFHLSTLFEWSFVVTHQEDPILRRMTAIRFSRKQIRQAMDRLPLTAADDELLHGAAPWYREWISRRDLGDPLWKNANFTPALEQVKIPVLLQGGWQDGFLRQTVAAYARLADRGADVALTMGPWTHAEGGAKGGQVLLPEAVEWLDAHLAGSGGSRRTTPVKVFVNGPGGGWRELPAWPPATTEHAFYPGAGNVLSARPADAGSIAEFTYDPADPTPTYGGAYVSMANTFAAGWKDDSDLAKRSDLLTFTSEPLTAELEVAGTPVAEVGHSSDNPFADLFVRLSEVDAKGRSRNIADGMLRLDPSSPTDLVRLELDPIAHRFARGSRIRLTVAGGSHPRWERNLGTGDDPATSTRMLPSHRTIDLSASRVVLPVVTSPG